MMLFIRIAGLFSLVSVLLIALALALGRLMTGDMLMFIARAENDQRDIFLTDLTRRITRNLTQDIFAESGASWSPDGQRIAFISNRDGGSLFTIDIGGNDLRRLIPPSNGTLMQALYQPIWSPDGTRIAYIAPYRNRWEIYLINADGSNRRRLTSHYASTYPPVWSPDGTRIAFVSLRDGSEEIYVVRVDRRIALGTTIRNLSRHPARDYLPAWSPDGREIVFVSNRDPLDQLFIVDTVSARLRRLTWEEADHYNPVWSPDGRWIAANFIPRFPASSRIAVIDTLTGEWHTLAVGNTLYYGPAWSPDGTRIAFASVTNAVYDVRVIDAVTGVEQAVIEVGAVDSSPVWQPRPPERP
jgi:Tol biopolymer transport system component